jgi:hypothetical protein
VPFSNVCTFGKVQVPICTFGNLMVPKRIAEQVEMPNCPVLFELAAINWFQSRQVIGSSHTAFAVVVCYSARTNRQHRSAVSLEPLICRSGNLMVLIQRSRHAAFLSFIIGQEVHMAAGG